MEDKKQLKENELDQVSGGVHGEPLGPRALVASAVDGQVDNLTDALASGLGGGIGGGLGAEIPKELENVKPNLAAAISEGLKDSRFGMIPKDGPLQ